jgi:hypothetical protein
MGIWVPGIMLHHREWATFKVLWLGCSTYICRCAGNSSETRPVTAGEGPRGGLGNNHSVRRGPLATCIFWRVQSHQKWYFAWENACFLNVALNIWRNGWNMQQHAATCIFRGGWNMQQKHAFSRGACFARSGAAKKMHVSYQLLTHKMGEPCIFI